MRRFVRLSMLFSFVCTGPVAADDAQIIRIGTSGDYAPFSVRQHAAEAYRVDGFDPAVARAWAQARGFEPHFVEFRWPNLLSDLAADRFDVAMSGITVRTERSLAGRFSVPVATSGAVVLIHEDAAAKSVSDLDRPGLRIAVNAGGHLERVARTRFPLAQLTAVADNGSVLGRLAEGRADAVVTDTQEAPHWLKTLPGLRVLGPFTRDRKAYLLGPDDGELARDLDTWLMASEADGTLARLRSEHLGANAAGPLVAAPLPALLAAMDERLALMPLVAEAKRLSGAPVDVPEREEMVLQAAARGVAEAAAARARGAGGHTRGAPDPAAVRRLFRLQIEAAKDIQRAILASPAEPGAPPPPNLASELRPALIRIGQRIAFLLVALPADLSPGEVRAAAGAELWLHDLPPERLDELADALHAVAARAPTATRRPAAAPAPPE